MYKYKIKIQKVSGSLNESILPSKKLNIKTRTKKSKENLFLEARKYFKNHYGLTVESIIVEASPRLYNHEDEIDNETEHYYGMHAQKNHHLTRGKVNLTKLRNDIARAILDLNYSQLEYSAGNAHTLYIDLMGNVSLETYRGETYPSDSDFYSHYEDVDGIKPEHGENRYSFDCNTYFGHGDIGMNIDNDVLEKLYEKIQESYQYEIGDDECNIIYNETKDEMISDMESILESGDVYNNLEKRAKDSIYGFIYENILYRANKIIKDYIKMNKGKGTILRNIRKV